MSELLSEEQVKEKLGIKDFRSIPKRKVIEFVSCIPNMNKELAKECINQFPNFANFANVMVEHLKDSYAEIITNDDVIHDSSIKSYQMILDDLSYMLHDKNENFDKSYIIDKMIYVTDKIEEINHNHINDRHELFRDLLKLAGVTIAGGLGILGIKIFKK